MGKSDFSPCADGFSNSSDENLATIILTHAVTWQRQLHRANQRMAEGLGQPAMQCTPSRGKSPSLGPGRTHPATHC